MQNNTLTIATLQEENIRLRQRLAELEGNGHRPEPLDPGPSQLDSVAQLRRIIQHMPVILVAIDESGNLVVWNEEAERITGYAPDEICGTPIWPEMLYPDATYRASLFSEWVSKDNNFRNLEANVTTKDGAVKIIAWSSIAKHFPIPGWLSWSVGVDVTEQRRAEEHLKSERHFINTVLDTTGFIVIVLYRDGTIVRFNRACEQVTGYTFAEVKGKYIWDLFLIPEEIEPVKGVFHQLRAGMFPMQYENYWLTKNQERRLIAWDNTALLDANGEVEYLIGTGVDITERKRAEEERAVLQQQIIETQSAALRELSTPLIPIANNVVIMPLIGAIDSQRAQQIMETLLEGVANHQAEIAIIDITGVQLVDTQVANALIRASQAVKLLGAKVVLTGIQPQIAQTLVHIGIDLSDIITRATLQSGIAYALAR